MRLADARLNAAAFKSALRDGTDPKLTAEAEAKAPDTASEPAVPLWATIAKDYLMLRQRSGAAPRTMAKLDRQVGVTTKKLGQRPINQITAEDILAVVNPVAERGQVENAHEIRSRFSQIFRYAASRGLIDSDPVAFTIGAMVKRRRGEFSGVTDPKTIGQLMRAINAYLNSLLMAYSPDPQIALEKAKSHSLLALDINADAAVAHVAMAYVHLYLHEHDLAIESADRAISLAPSNGRIAAQAGWVIAASGSPQRGEALLRFGMRTQPSPPVWVPNLLAVTLPMQRRLDEAEVLFDQANAILPNPNSHSHLAAIAALRNDNDGAAHHVKSSIEVYPSASVEGAAQYFAYIRDKDYFGWYLSALRNAGYPETSSVSPNTND